MALQGPNNMQKKTTQLVSDSNRLGIQSPAEQGRPMGTTGDEQAKLLRQVLAVVERVADQVENTAAKLDDLDSTVEDVVSRVGRIESRLKDPVECPPQGADGHADAVHTDTGMPPPSVSDPVAQGHGLESGALLSKSHTFWMCWLQPACTGAWQLREDWSCGVLIPRLVSVLLRCAAR